MLKFRRAGSGSDRLESDRDAASEGVAPDAEGLHDAGGLLSEGVASLAKPGIELNGDDMMMLTTTTTMPSYSLPVPLQ